MKRRLFVVCIQGFVDLEARFEQCIKERLVSFGDRKFGRFLQALMRARDFVVDLFVRSAWQHAQRQRHNR
ncbi:hypothetical protein [Prosthecobacter sp.]|uniref:hypothetical protein n=1 Tax=Prosthecobacter sp. TaxID=1965333 RepID=UPI002ABA680D|nr:hypothetical protein [Prosthecobacter sp.]MDZ4402036.1 hypothetical protein [Prosthecobacter sp.]